MNAGSWFSAPRALKRVKLLRDVLDPVCSSLRIDIEIKGVSVSGSGVEVEIARDDPTPRPRRPGTSLLLEGDGSEKDERCCA